MSKERDLHVHNIGLALLGTVICALPSQGFAANPSAAQSTTKACSVQYQAAKTANTLGGKTWPQFLSDCSASMNSAAAAPVKAATSTVAATEKATKTASASKSTATAAADYKTPQQICSAQYQTAKTGGTLNGQKWPDFLKACKAGIASDSEDAAAPPDEPKTSTVAATVPAVAASGKPLTPGQVAFRQRIHECSVEWQGDKSAGTLPAGQKWPQFWSACNTRLKAQG